MTNIYALRGIKQSPEKSFLSTQSSPRTITEKALAIIDEQPVVNGIAESAAILPAIKPTHSSTPTKDKSRKKSGTLLMIHLLGGISH